MVHTRTPNQWQNPPHDKDQHFWKLVRHEGMTCSRIKESLREAGYPIKATANKEELMNQHIRYQRGLLNYGRCAVAELRTFCVARGLASTREVKRMRSPNMIHKLTQADNGETFNRFLDLPAELRVHIYEMYLKEFDTPGAPLAAPFPIPLAESCTLVRHEVMPVYLGTTTFDFNLWQSPPWRRGSGSGVPTLMDFVHDGAAWQVALLRKLRMEAIIQGLWEISDDARMDSLLCCHIDLGTDHKCASFQIDHVHSEEEGAGEFDVITSLFQRVIDTVNQRAGGRRLLKSDIEDIVDIFGHPPSTLMRPSTPEHSDGSDDDDEDDEDDDDD